MIAIIAFASIIIICLATRDASILTILGVVAMIGLFILCLGIIAWVVEHALITLLCIGVLMLIYYARLDVNYGINE